MSCLQVEYPLIALLMCGPTCTPQRSPRTILWLGEDMGVLLAWTTVWDMFVRICTVNICKYIIWYKDWPWETRTLEVVIKQRQEICFWRETIARRHSCRCLAPLTDHTGKRARLHLEISAMDFLTAISHSRKQQVNTVRKELKILSPHWWDLGNGEYGVPHSGVASKIHWPLPPQNSLGDASLLLFSGWWIGMFFLFAFELYSLGKIMSEFKSLFWTHPFDDSSQLYLIYPYILIEGSLEVKLPTIWRDEKQSRAEAQRRGRLEERR